MRYILETYGCQMNKAESSALEIILSERGWLPAADVAEADLVLINTCSVRATAETRAWGRIDLYAAHKRARACSGSPLTLALAGCMAERLKTEIRSRQPAVDYVIGTFQKQAFGLILDAIEKNRPIDHIDETPAFVFAPSHYEPGAFRAFVPIMHGCDNFCSYCIVPYLRGREISRDPEAILAEIDRLQEAGVREITLLGQNVNSYRYQGDSLDFPELLRRIAAHLRSRGRGGIRWIRFLTSHPKDLSADLIKLMAEEPLLCSHVHLCLQSGSNRVLKAMNRRYSREDYLSLVERMRASIPGLSLSTDILVGFPGETEEDLELTLDLMRRVGFSYSFMYHFNPRDGTPAASMAGRISEKLKRARLSRVIELQSALSSKLMADRVGAEEEVLVESVSKKKASELLARTQRDETLVFPGPADLVGNFARVRLSGIVGKTFKAELLS